jgi:hypothetical protein
MRSRAVRSFRRVVAVLSVSAALVAAAAVGPAAAGPPADATFAGGCLGGVVDLVAGPASTYALALSMVVVGYSPTPEHNPVHVVQVTCTVLVDGAQVATIPVAGVGPVAVLAPTLVAIGSNRAVPIDICQRVDLVDAHSQPASFSSCQSTVSIQFPPQPILDLIDALPGIVAGAPCQALRAVAPVALSTVLLVDTTGDVWINGVKRYDC